MARKWLEVQRQKRRGIDAKTGKPIESTHWYGRMKVGGKWQWFKLFTDKRASQKRWEEIISQQDLRESGIITPHMEAAKQPLGERLADYKASLKRICTDEHYRIADKMLDRFITLAGWKTLADVNEPSASRALQALGATGKTVAYCNQYIARVKAFLNWCIPDRLATNPLAKLKRGNIRKAKKVKARRPLSEAELAGLLGACKPYRVLQYAIPAYTGLRRKELSQIVWGDLHLDSIIPFIRLRPEITKTGFGADLPLHPYIANELKNLTQAMPATLLFKTLPEGRTMLRDLQRAGITQTDGMGRRADYHALRHTFAKRLDETGCSHATRRALMRHSIGDQTDGYTLARMSEMYHAITRLPWPNEACRDFTMKTGTADSQADTMLTREGPSRSLSVTQNQVNMTHDNKENTRKNQGDAAQRHSMSPTDLNEVRLRDNVSITRPRSSVG